MSITSSRHVLEERERWQDKRSFCDSHPLLASHAHTAKRRNNHSNYSISVLKKKKKAILVYFPTERISVVYQLV